MFASLPASAGFCAVDTPNHGCKPNGGVLGAALAAACLRWIRGLARHRPSRWHGCGSVYADPVRPDQKGSPDHRWVLGIDDIINIADLRRGSLDEINWDISWRPQPRASRRARARALDVGVDSRLAIAVDSRSSGSRSASQFNAEIFCPLTRCLAICKVSTGTRMPTACLGARQKININTRRLRIIPCSQICCQRWLPNPVARRG